MTSSRCASSGSDLHHLFTEHQSWLVNWLRKRLSNSCDAADLSQDTWVRMIASGKIPMPHEARPYLRQIANGLAIDLHRRRVLEQEYLNALANYPDKLAPSAQEQAIVMETLVQLDQLLSQMPAKTRDVFILSRLDGLTYSEIAQQLGIAVATVRKNMYKAVLICSGLDTTSATP